MKIKVPLAFALTLSTHVAATASVGGDNRELLQPGSLRKITELADNQLSKRGGHINPEQARRRMAQPCWSGYWRRC